MKWFDVSWGLGSKGTIGVLGEIGLILALTLLLLGSTSKLLQSYSYYLQVKHVFQSLILMVVRDNLVNSKRYMPYRRPFLGFGPPRAEPIHFRPKSDPGQKKNGPNSFLKGDLEEYFVNLWVQKSWEIRGILKSLRIPDGLLGKLLGRGTLKYIWRIFGYIW